MDEAAPVVLDGGQASEPVEDSMKKIISLFMRNYEGNRLVRDEIVPGAEWVAAGEGIATRKYDGTCALVSEGKLFKRYDAKNGKAPPADFIPAQDPDPITGHWPGWIPIGDGPDDRWFREAASVGIPVDGTYELCGPKVQGNPEKFGEHVLVQHGADVLNAPHTFQELREWFTDKDIEGVVWHHPDGRMVKIKKRDFFGRR